MGQREDLVEKNYHVLAQRHGFVDKKGSNLGKDYPDRITMKGQSFFWVELKDPKGKLSPGQKIKFKQLVKKKQKVYVLSSIEEVELFWDLMMSGGMAQLRSEFEYNP